MRRVAVVHLIWWLGLAVPAGAGTQTAPQAPAPAKPAGAQTKPPATPPPSDPQAKPPAAQDAPAPAAEEEQPPSLFAESPRQVELGGRLSSVSGDPARFQRYQDIRDGILLDAIRYAWEQPEGASLFRAAADNVGWRDQRFFAAYERTGRFAISGRWDEIPQFYSVDTATPYTQSGEGLVLDDATQRRIQSGQANLSAWVPLAPQFDLQERRDIGDVRFIATPTPQLDVTASFTTNRHVGELPWGASFGFNNDVEVALPYDSRANDFSIGAEWTNTRSMVNIAYTGSWFDNLDDPLVWDSPLRADDSTSAPGRGRMSLWPSNSAQTVSIGGFTKFAKRTQLTGFLSFGSWNNDEPLQPFTINAALPQLTLPRATTDAAADVFSTNLNLVSRPVKAWRLGARLRHYSYSNETSPFSISQFVSYDTSINDANTGGPKLFAHSRTTFDADATWTGLQPIALTLGYARNNGSYDFRIFESTGEDVFRITADAVGSQFITFRANYEASSRNGSGLDENLLIEVGEQPAMRHYDVANRTRNQFTGQMDVVPNDLWIVSVSAGVGADDYDDSYFGLQDSSFRTFSLAADYRQANGFGAGASYNYERYEGNQRSRSASTGQETDPMRDWTAESAERVNYFSIYATPPRIGRNTEVRLSYDYSHAEGSYLYAVVPGGPLPAPNQLPNVFNKLQQLRLDGRYRLSKNLIANLSYLYEPFRVYDFAFDQSVVNGIVQPSSLVMGYIYRPYTAHSAVFGVRYFW